MKLTTIIIAIMTASMFAGCTGSNIIMDKNISKSEIQIGDTFPTMKGETLGGLEMELPKDLNAKVSILILGFSYKSRYQVEPWGKEVSVVLKQHPELAFLEMPMMGGGLQYLMKPFTDMGMRSGTPKDAHNNVMCIYGSNAELQRYFNVLDQDAAYLFVLDREGRVRWKYAGAITDDAFQQLKNKVDDLLKSDYTKNSN